MAAIHKNVYIFACIIACWITLIGVDTVQASTDCGAKGIQCVNTTAYRTCWSVWWWTEYGTEVACPAASTCDQETGDDYCPLDPTTTPVPETTTITEAPTTASSKWQIPSWLCWLFFNLFC